MNPEASAYWVNANVILRFLTGEPPEMAESAATLFEKVQRGDLVLRVHSVTVAETVWVLGSFYGYSRKEIAGSVAPLISGKGFRSPEGRVVIRVLESMAENNVDFADALVAEAAQSRGEGVSSFDGDFRRLGLEWSEPDGPADDQDRR